MLKKLLKMAVAISGWTIAIIFVLYLLLLLIANLPPVQRYVLAIAEKHGSKAISGSLSIKSYSTNLLSFIELYNIEIKTSSEQNDSVFIDKLHVDFSILPLVQQKIVLPKISATGGTLYALRDKSGKFKIPGIPIPSKKPAQKKKGQWQLQIGNVCASEMDLKYFDVQLQMTITLKNLHGCARLDSLQASLSSEDLKILSPRMNADFDTLYVNARMQDSQLHVDRFLLNGSILKLLIEGQIPISPGGVFNLYGQLSADIASMTYALVPAEHRIAGTLNSHFKVTGIITSPDVQTTISSSTLSYRDIPIDSFYVQAHLDQNDSLRMDSYVENKFANANIGIDAVLKSIFKKPQLERYHIVAHVKRINVSLLNDYFHINKPELKGVATLNLLASGKNLKDLPADVFLNLAVSEKGPLSIDTVFTYVSIKDSSWFMHALLGKGNLITGKGKIKLNNVFNGSIKGNIGKPYLLSSLFSKYPVKGDVYLNASFFNVFNNPRLQLNISSDSLYWRGLNFTDLNAGVKYSNLWLIDSMHSGISADLQKVIIPGIENLKGNLNAMIQARGNVLNPEVHSKIKISDPGYLDWLADDFSADIFYKNSHLLIDSMSLLKDTILFDNTAALELLTPGYSFQMTSNVSVNSTSAVQLRSAGRYVKDSVQLTGVIDYARTGLLVPKIPVFQCIDGKFQLNAVFDKSYCLENGNLLMQLNKYAVELSDPYQYTGSFIYNKEGLNGNFRILKKKDSLSVMLASIRAPSQNGCFRKGIAFANGSAISLTARNFEFGELAQTFFPDMFIRGMVHGSANSVLNNGAWLLDGNLHVEAETLSWLQQAMNLSGLKANAILRGTLIKPVIGFSVFSKSISFNEKSSVNIRGYGTLFQNRIEIDSLYSYFQDHGYLYLNGVVPLSWKKGNVAPEIRYDFSRVPLFFVNEWLPAVTIKEGSISGKGEIHTASTMINANGKINIDDLKFHLNDCSGVAGPFDASIKLKNDQVIMNSFSGKWGDGKINAKGSMKINLKAIKDINAGLSIRNFNISCLDEIQIGIEDATSRIYKYGSTYNINANVKLGESRIDTVFTISGILNSFSDGRQGGFMPDALLQKVNLEAGIDLNSNLLIDSNLGRFLLDGRMNISGPANRPVFNGVITIDEGSVRYLDREFEIDDGTITQFSANEINPTLNIDASSDVQDMTSSAQTDYDVNVAVRGTLKNPKITLSSNPALNQQEIINLLTFGGKQGGPGFQARGGQILSSYVTGLGSQYIEQITGLGNVSLSGNVFTQNGGLSLTINQNLTSRISVLYDTDVTDIGRYAVQVMYRILRPIRLIGKTDSRGNSQIGVQFIFRR